MHHFFCIDIQISTGPGQSRGIVSYFSKKAEKNDTRKTNIREIRQRKSSELSRKILFPEAFSAAFAPGFSRFPEMENMPQQFSTSSTRTLMSEAKVMPVQVSSGSIPLPASEAVPMPHRPEQNIFSFSGVSLFPKKTTIKKSGPAARKYRTNGPPVLWTNCTGLPAQHLFLRKGACPKRPVLGQKASPFRHQPLLMTFLTRTR